MVLTSVKTAEAVLHDKIGTSDTGLCQFVAARDAICQTETKHINSDSQFIMLLPSSKADISYAYS